MGYIDKQGLIDRWGEEQLIKLTTDARSATAIDDTVLETAISDASGEVDGYVGAAYSLPLATVPELLVSATVDVVAFKLHKRKPAGVPQHVKDAYDAAVRLLRDISQRKVSLGKVPEPPQNPGRAAILKSGKRLFSRDALRGF